MSDDNKPMTDDEAAAFHREVTTHLKRLLIRALGANFDGLPVIALDMPGVLLAARRANDKHGGEIILGVPDELVRNLMGDPEKRDLVLLVHVPRSLQNKIEGLEAAIILPN